VKKNIILRSWIDFNEALHLYIIKHEIDEYNFNCFERLNQSIIKICIKHADKRAKKISFNNVDKLSCTLLLSKDAWVMLTFNMSIKKSLINDLMSIIVDVIWNNDTDDSFTTFSAVVLMKMNDYVDFISMLINDWNVVSIFLRTATWNNCYDPSYAPMLVAMLMAMLVAMFMAIAGRSSLGYRMVPKPTLFRVSLCSSEPYR